MDNEGWFVTMDFKTGKVAESRPWKTVRLRTSYKSGRELIRYSFPTLDERDVREAVNMVLRLMIDGRLAAPPIALCRLFTGSSMTAQSR